MRLRLDTTAALVEKIPSLHIDAIRDRAGRKFAPVRQAYLAELIELGYSRRRRHKTQSAAFSVSAVELIEGLHAPSETYPAIIAPILEFPPGKQGFSIEQRQTKPYRLRPEVETAAHEVFTGCSALPVVCRDTGREVMPEQLPTNGLPADLALPFTVPSILPLRVSDVDRAIDRVREWIAQTGNDYALLNREKGDDSMTLADAVRRLYIVRQWVQSLGGLPNFYTLQQTGRLGPTEATAHVLTLPSTLRRLLLARSGLCDFDVKACHWSILSAVGHALGFPTEHMDDYLAHRDEWHGHLANVTGCRYESRIKRVLLSLLNGGTLSSSPMTENAKALGVFGMQRLSADERTQCLYREVRHGLKALLKACQRATVNGERLPVNALGLTLEPAEGSRKSVEKSARPSFQQECAHVLVGIEQVAIRAMAEKVTGLQALCYDGWISPPQDTRPLEDHARDVTTRVLGYPVSVSLTVEPFSTLVPDPDLDAADF